MSVSVPFFTPSRHVGARHDLPAQTREQHWLAWAQRVPFARQDAACVTLPVSWIGSSPGAPEHAAPNAAETTSANTPLATLIVGCFSMMSLSPEAPTAIDGPVVCGRYAAARGSSTSDQSRCRFRRSSRAVSSSTETDAADHGPSGTRSAWALPARRVWSPVSLSGRSSSASVSCTSTARWEPRAVGRSARVRRDNSAEAPCPASTFVTHGAIASVGPTADARVPCSTEASGTSSDPGDRWLRVAPSLQLRPSRVGVRRTRPIRPRSARPVRGQSEGVAR
jgi:hypothetical protein